MFLQPVQPKHAKRCFLLLSLITNMRHNTSISKNMKTEPPQNNSYSWQEVLSAHSSSSAAQGNTDSHLLQGLSVFSIACRIKMLKCTTLKHLMQVLRTLTNLFKYLQGEIVLRHGSQIGLSTHLAPDIAV